MRGKREKMGWVGGTLGYDRMGNLHPKDGWGEGGGTSVVVWVAASNESTH